VTLALLLSVLVILLAAAEQRYQRPTVEIADAWQHRHVSNEYTAAHGNRRRA